MKQWRVLPSQKVDCYDLDSVVKHFSKKVHDKLARKLLHQKNQGYGLKFVVKVRVLLQKYSDSVQDYVRLDFWFPSASTTVYKPWNLKKAVARAFGDIFARFDTFVHQGSGWSLRQVLELNLTASSFKIIRGGCSSQVLPSALKGSHGVLSLDQCPKDQCFIYAVAAALAKVKRNPARITNQAYATLLKLLPKTLEFPVKVSDLRVFERSCKQVSLNVYGFESGVPFPYYISGKTRKLHVNLLLFKGHYYPIRNLSSLLKVNNGSSRRKTFVCQLCISFFTNEKRFKLHQDLCKGEGPKLEFPDEDESTMEFSSFRNMIAAPFTLYCDFETLVLAPETKDCAKKLLSTRKHQAIAAGGLTVCRSDFSLSSRPFIYTGTDCVSALLDWILSEVQRIRGTLERTNEPLQMDYRDRKQFSASKSCEMCHTRFSRRTPKVRDHDHLNGSFRFALCNSCNLTFAKTRFGVNIFFHGLSNYDSHFLVQELHKYDTGQIKVIPKTGEKFLSMSLGEAHFKDSFQFLSSSLANLAANLLSKGEDHFHCTRYFVRNHTKRNYFFKKGVFPYSYMSSLSRLQDRELPPIACFKNDLSGEDLPEEDYALAQKVWSVFECETMQDYMEIYLLCDVLLLADVFEAFRSKSLVDYGLDPVFYFSTPHFTMDAFLKQSQVSLDLILDLNQYLFLIQGIRGGLSVVSKRFSSANNPELGHRFDPKRASRYILYLDANNLYGKAMMEPMPTSDFLWMENSELHLNYILSLPPDGENGCIVECDLEYPANLHKLHADFPLAPHRHKVRLTELSPTARQICERNNLKHSVGTEKLMTTFLPRKAYVVHFRNLQLYVKLGMKVSRIHRGIKFKQSPVFKEYIEFNSTKRALATNSFDTDYYKLLSNSLFGKTIERPEKRCRVVLTSDPKKHQKLVGSPCYKASKIIHPKLVGVTLSYPAVKVKKPFYVGMAILEIAKVWMYSFHYEVMKAHFGSSLQLLYTDTDSLLYEVTHPHVYKELGKLSSFFDFSNYPVDHHLFSADGKREPGLFKDEVGGRIITEFVGLRSKMYSFKVEGEGGMVEENKTAKGVKASVIKRQLHHEDYKNCLFEQSQLEHNFNHITSKSHSVVTALKRKISLSPFDDKRFLLNNVKSVPYGSDFSS